MQSMHSFRMRCADPSQDSGSAACQGATRNRASLTTRFAALALLIATAAILPACSSGSGGDNGAQTPRDEVNVQGLNFTYPFDGQLDVVLDSQMVINFPSTISGASENALQLQDVDGNTVGPDVTVTVDDNQDNILRLVRDGDLLPNTDYEVVATTDLSAGSTQFSSGDVLFSFRTRPLEGRPADGDFAVTSLSPGEENDLTPDRSSKFTEFNAIRVVFNEPVDASTVDDDSFIVTGPDGERVFAGTNGNPADARLTALGRYIVFDPIEDLAPGEYTIQYTDAITSVFGKPLTGDTKTRTVLDVGDQTTDQILVIEEDSSAANVDQLDDDFLGGTEVNNVNIFSQLIGSNDQPVIGPEDVPSGTTPPIRNRVATTLATPGLPGFDDVFPAVIRAGQKFQLTQLSLALGGGIPTPVISGPIDVNFPNDVDVYLQSNDYRNIETPTAVRLRLDLSIGTLITAAISNSQNYIIQQLANGVFNQSVLNIQAAGLAIPRDNGDLEISTLGSFPINVNRTDNATVNFGLTLVLPANPDAVEEGSGTEDVIQPFLTAQSPSACLYAFGSPGYNALYASASPTSFPEPFCVAPLNGNAPPNGGLGVSVNSFPIESSPAVTFSSPIDPASVNAQSISLVGPAGTVDSTYRVEGFSVVIDPAGLLEADEEYDIQINQGANLTDLAGNAVTFDNRLGPNAQTLAFTTEPLTDTNPTPVLLGTLTPGLPCALEGGNFATSGGDTAGNCIGNADNGTADDYPVFTSPVNAPVDGVFSKFVSTDTVVLADGCLTSGSNANTVQGASIALQEMDGSQCVGTPDAELAFANDRGDALTRSFTIRPVEALKPQTRYWVVVCGEHGTNCVNNAGTIVDMNNLALNTTPLQGTGSTTASTDTGGGPDILMPFDTLAADASENQDYYTNQFTLPETDTNGNGQFDEGEERPQPGNRSLVRLTTGGVQISGEAEDGKFASYLALARPIALRNITDSCSRVSEVAFDDDSSAVGETPDNCIPASLLPGGINSLTSINIGIEELTSLLSNTLDPVLTGLLEELQILQQAQSDNPSTPISEISGLGGALDNVVGTVGGVLGGQDDGSSDTDLGGVLGLLLSDAPLGEQLAGTLNNGSSLGDLIDLLGETGSVVEGLLDTLLGSLADLPAPVQTGRILLRFPNDDSGDADRVTQTGHIVEKCEGTFANGVAYDFEPCFAASLDLVANAPDGQAVALEQQGFTANIVGPVTFEQNGRLVISVRNANTITLNATALGLLPAEAEIAPGDLNFQLVGNATHGGRAFPNR